MDKEFEKAKEILRQGELRVKGSLDFSKELDDKIFKLLSASIATETGLLFFILNKLPSNEISLMYSSWFAFFIFMVVIITLIHAGRPMPYKGVGLPLDEFDNRDISEILSSSKGRYTTRFKDNSELNYKKGKSLNKGTVILSTAPLFIALSYLSFSFSLFLPVINIFFIFILVVFLFKK